MTKKWGSRTTVCRLPWPWAVGLDGCNKTVKRAALSSPTARKRLTKAISGAYRPAGGLELEAEDAESDTDVRQKDMMMKMTTSVGLVAILCAALCHAESPDIEITPDKPEHAGIHFAVVGETTSTQICWVAVAVAKPGKRLTHPGGYLEVWDGNRFVCAVDLRPCALAAIPDKLKARIKGEGATLFAFKINPMYLKATWVNVQFQNEKPDNEPVNYVIHLRDFIGTPNQAMPRRP